MKKWIIIGIILLVVIIVSVYFYKKSKKESEKTSASGSSVAQRLVKSALVTDCEARGGTWGILSYTHGTVNGVEGDWPNYGCTVGAATK